MSVESPQSRMPTPGQSGAVRREVSPRVPSATTTKTLILHLLASLLLASAVLFPRTVSMTSAHTECYDDHYHLWRGLKFFDGTINQVDELNDPHLGAAISAVPLKLSGARPRSTRDHVLYNQPVSVETLRLRTALWKTFLYLPLIAVAFLWCHALYGLGAAWLAAALFVIEPTFTAHMPLPTLDVLGVEGIVIACYVAWRYYRRPRLLRLGLVSFATAVALLLKHTALVLPGVIVAIGVALILYRFYVEKDRTTRRRSGLHWRKRTWTHFAIGSVLIAFFVWGLTGFDYAPFAPGFPKVPARMYLESLREGLVHASRGHPSYFLGEFGHTGWWYYFPVVATFKVPLGLLALGALALYSFRKRPLSRDELAILVPLLAWTGLMLISKLHFSFRHFLPAYAFMILLACRVVPISRPFAISALALTLLSAIHVATYHHDYLSYLNFPRAKAAQSINDSNLDWGQAFKQIAKWVDERKDEPRDIWVEYSGQHPLGIRHYLGRHVDSGRIKLAKGKIPEAGLLIIGPPWELFPPFHEQFGPIIPDEYIGHAVHVYDLDRINAKR